jgi:acyl carrier protein/NAD(P)-dependent dehydrogenase (short-subunit alcohol dehydrogenase family)
VTGEEVVCPGKAAVLAPIKIIPLEYPHITCQGIDILVPAPGSRQEDIFMDYLVQEFTAASQGLFVAYRGMHRWTQSYKRVRLDKPPAGESDLSIKEGSVCLVTGEGGDTAIATAGYLLNRLKARVILILPPDDSPGKGRGKPREWEEAGAPIMIANVDNSSRQMMEKVVKKAKKRFGRVNALIHMPGDTAEAGKIQEMSPRMSSAFVAASMKRILVMDQVLKDMDTEPDFVMLFSTIGTAVYPSQVGNVSQCAANDFLDAFSIYKTSGDNTFASTINNWLTPQDLQVEWGDILNSILENKLPRVLVSPVDLKNLVLHYNEYEASIRPQEPGEDSDDKAAVWETVSLQRRGLSTPYKAPDTDTEKSLAKIWQKFFGIDRLGTHDDFFQLGGDSLQAMAIVNNIHHSLHVKVPIDFFFSNSTIRELACYIQSQSKKEARVYWQPVEKKEYYPLTPMQSTILYVNQMDPNSLTYNISFALEMKLNLNKRILTGALAKLIETHEILRTSFENIEGKSLQRVHDYEAIDFDVEYLEPTGNHEESISRITKNFIRPFDLRRAPLLRAALIKITHGGGIKYIMVLDMHHIAADGDSGNIITRGLAALARGEELPRLNIQYKDYAVWYHNQMESGLIKTQEEYWIKQFEKVPPVLNLPTDYQRPVPRSYDGDFLNFEIEEEKSGQLRTLAREDSATLTMVLLCIYSIFLSKLTGQEDIVIAAPFNGRIHNQLLPVIGMLVKTLYFRFYPTREKLFVEFLREVRTRAVEAYENQDYPPDTLANRIGLKRSPGRNPITDAGFSLVKIGETIIDEGPSTPAPHVNPYDLGRSDLVVMDINLIVIEKGNRISFRFAYLTGLFKKETIKRFALYFKNILDVVLENKNIPLKNIRLSNDLLEAEPNITDVDFDL